MSINRVRNCVVHRNGIVAERDIPANGKLILEWTAPVLVVADKSGEREVILPVSVEAGSGVSLRDRPHRKEFAVGEEVSLSTEEFSGICYTLIMFGNSSAQSSLAKVVV